MERKRTVDEIVSSYRLLNSAKIGKMEDSEKFAVIKAVRQLKKVGVDFDDFVKDAQEKLKPEGFDAIARKAQEKKELTPEETSVLNKYNQDINKCLIDEAKKEVELTFDLLSDEAIGRLVASNDFTIGEIETISNVLGE